MQVPLQVAFRNMPHSHRIVEQIEAHVAHLESFYDRITSCRVVVDIPHRHHDSGNLYQVRIDITVPGHEIVVNRESSQQTQFKDLDTALGHAFDAATRQVEDLAKQRRTKAKHHESQPHARVARLFDDDEYGFIETFDGREIYFHAHSLINGDFQKLELGTEVTFVEELGDKGPQASTVRIVGRHSHA
ncbi:MAG: HPF/RaiA family ribosome-associated protein [Planctomycetota bacterium]|nr:MAG: HPF/RaiA family ribosome-associated protein [Planctomycetota bacterium]